jgi:hypothetical protein
MFIVINYALTAVARLVERRLQRSARGGPPVDLALTPAAPGAAAAPLSVGPGQP